MRIVEEQFLRVWPNDAQRGQCAVDLQCWMSESPAVLTQTWGKNVRFNLIEGPTYVYLVWKILSFECNFCNISWAFSVATRINGKAGHMSDMFICNQFKKVRTVRPTDTVWADFIGNENSTNTSIELSIRGHWEWFTIKIF